MSLTPPPPTSDFVTLVIVSRFEGTATARKVRLTNLAAWLAQQLPTHHPSPVDWFLAWASAVGTDRTCSGGVGRQRMAAALAELELAGGIVCTTTHAGLSGEACVSLHPGVDVHLLKRRDEP